ncbi:MAG: hypothetical protein HRT71_08290 [Flavobacteriales bacterium]|nr:hypothetical protein [Flavobacteriales bacterium]
MLIGPNFSFPLLSDSKKFEALNSTKARSIDFGIGTDLKLKYITVSPEFRYARGIKNIFNDDRAIYDNNELIYHYFTLVLVFT